MRSYRERRLSQGWISEHFRYHEFACPCCGVSAVRMRLVDALERLRTKCGNRPITVTSGFRCANWNKIVGGVPASRHCVGEAADIVVAGLHPLEVAEIAERIEPFSHGGIGTYPDRGFVHVDVRHGGPARWTG